MQLNEPKYSKKKKTNNNKLTIYGTFALSCFCTYLPLY